jgi:hypothetical protein
MCRWRVGGEIDGLMASLIDLQDFLVMLSLLSR